MELHTSDFDVVLMSQKVAELFMISSYGQGYWVTDVQKERHLFSFRK